MAYENMDFTHLSNDEIINGIKATNVPNHLRNKAYGKDTRETMAQLAEMIIQLGVNLSLDPDGALEWARKLQESVSQSEFDSWVATLLDGGPSLFFETKAALVAKHPNGAPGVALVRETDPAKIYVWNGTSWEDFGDYQGVEIKDGTVTTEKLANQAVSADKTDFAKKEIISDNIFDNSKVRINKFASGNFSTSDLAGYFLSQRIGYETATNLTIKNVRAYRFYDEAGVAYGYVNTNSNTAVTTLTIPAGHTLEFSGVLSNLGTTQVNIGEALLPYDEYTESVVIENLYISSDAKKETGNFKVVRNGNVLDVVSKSGTDELVIKLNLSTRDNKLFNFLNTTLNGTMIHGTTDSITPIRVPYAIGANHGYPTGSTQIYPAVKNIDLRVEGIGDYNGTYMPGKLKIVESYDILDWNSVTEWESQNPSKPYADNLSQIDSVARLSTSYEFSYFGRCYISTSVYFYKSTEIGNLGFLQAEGLYGGNGDYAGVTRYAPDVKTVSGYNFQNGFGLDSLVDSLKISQTDLKDSDFPIVRYADYTSDYGFTMGYFFDKGDTNPTNRLAVADYYWDFRNTKKSYPIAYDATHTVSAGEYINIYGYRNYYLKDSDLTVYTEVEDGEAIYIYIDSNKALNLKTKRTIADVGSKIEILKNTGLTLISEYVTSDGIIFKTAEYCTAVLKINK